MYEEALVINQQIGQQSNQADNLDGIARILRAQGDLAEARQKEKEALAMVERIGERVSVPDGRLMLAWLSLDEGRPADAEKMARETSQEFERNKEVDREARARCALALSFLAQGRTSEAQRAADRATALSAKSESQPVRLLVAITVARVRAAAGGATAAARAIRSIEAARAEAKRAGRLGLEFEARLALGEIEMLSGHSATGRQHLERLAEDARARGFGLVARKAGVAASGGSSRTRQVSE
jgi:tetratricopeptide (TPR) repeat protein